MNRRALPFSSASNISSPPASIIMHLNRIFAPALRGKTVLVLALLAAATVFAAIPPAEKLLPADTLVVVSVPDAAKLRDLYGKSAQSRFWNDAAMKPFREKFLAKWNDEFFVPLERDLGVKFDDYSALPQGQVTVALTQNGWTGNDQDAAEPGVLFLLDTKDKSGQLKTNLADLRQRWTDAGKAIKTEKIRDLDFAIVPLSSNDLPKTLKSFFPQKQEIQELGKEAAKKPAPTDALVIGQFESLLIVGNSTKVIEAVMAHLTGGNAPALADDPAFEQNRLALFRDAGFYGWCNTRSFVDLLLKLPKAKPNPTAPDPMPLPELDKVIASLGLSGLKTLTFAFRDPGDGAVFEVFLGVPEASRQGLFKLMAIEAKDAAPPPFVPADVIKFQRFRLDGPKTIASLEKMLKDVSAQLIDSWEYLLKNGEEAMKQGDPNYDLRKNIFANLGDDVLIYQKAPRGNSLAELNSPPSLVAIASPNAEPLARALSGLLIIRSSDALAPKTREFLGKKIYSIGLSLGPPTPGPTESLSYAASGGYVVFSTDAATLEEFLRSAESPGKPLRETAGLADAAQRVGGQGTGMFTYENQAETMRIVFELLKKLTPATPAPSSSNPLVNAIPFAGPEKSLRDWMDFSLLPEFAKVSKYFYFSVWAGSANADGLNYKWFSPTPPGMK